MPEALPALVRLPLPERAVCYDIVVQHTIQCDLRCLHARSCCCQVFAAVPYCIDLIEGPYIETNEGIVKAFRPPAEVRKQRPVE